MRLSPTEATDPDRVAQVRREVEEELLAAHVLLPAESDPEPDPEADADLVEVMEIPLDSPILRAVAPVAADRPGLWGGATADAVAGPAPVWRPGDVGSFAPPGPRSKAAANLEALEVLRSVTAADRPATVEEQAVLARWSSWGSLPKVFDDDDTEWAPTRARLRGLLSATRSGRRPAAPRSTPTTPTRPSSPRCGSFLIGVGFGGGRVLEPGCGSGNFIGLTPPDVDVSWVGVELDPTTAAICRAAVPAGRHPGRRVRDHRSARRQRRRRRRQRPVRAGRLVRPSPQRGRRVDPQPLHHQGAPPVPARAARSPCSPRGTRWTPATRRPGRR